MLNNYIIITLAGAFYYFFIAQFNISYFIPNLMLLILFFLMTFWLNNNFFDLTLVSLYTFLLISQVEFLQIMPLMILGGLATLYIIYYFQKKFIRKTHGVYIILTSLLFFLMINLNFFLTAVSYFSFKQLLTVTLIDSSLAFIISFIYILVKQYVKTGRKIY